MTEQEIIRELTNIKILSLETANRCDKVLKTMSNPRKKKKMAVSEAEILRATTGLFKNRKP